MNDSPSRKRLLPHLSRRESASLMTRVLAPPVAKGVIIRRRRVLAMAELLDLDRRAVRRMERLADKYDRGPVLMGPYAGQYRAVILSPEHVGRVLHRSPEPYATRTVEKAGALSHFEPQGALISHGEQRADRRRFNEAALDTDQPLHRMHERFTAIVREEARTLESPTLRWDHFVEVWARVVRRVVFGDAARDDHEITELLVRLRKDANWAFLHPKRDRVRDRFFERLQAHLGRAEKGSLAGMMAGIPTNLETRPENQVPQWLFAFDPAGMATFRALALLASHPEQAARARRDSGPELPFIRACVLESLRLWPTTPLILRQTTEETEWEEGVMPAETGVIIFAPFFHRDRRRVDFADRFHPDVWLSETPEETQAFVPFSTGPARCPGRDLVLLLDSMMISTMLERPLKLIGKRLDPDVPLPGTLNHFTLEFSRTA